jgi:hypothetical protein
MKTLLSTVNHNMVKQEHLDRFAAIDATDFGNVRRKVRDDLAEQGITADEGYLNEGILALKQYYAIALLDPRNMHAISKELDPFWHAHILHTEEYVEFCKRVMHYYMHHAPLNHERKDHVQHVKRLYRYTLDECYPLFFNHINPLFYPSNPPDKELMCTHYACRPEEVDVLALLPLRWEMQKEAVLPALEMLHYSV